LKLTMPHIPCSDVSGVIVEVGSAVVGLQADSELLSILGCRAVTASFASRVRMLVPRVQNLWRAYAWRRGGVCGSTCVQRSTNARLDFVRASGGRIARISHGVARAHFRVRVCAW